MKRFDPIEFDLHQALLEVREFEQLLESRSSLGERNDVLPFFSSRRQLCGMCYVVSPILQIPTVNRIAREYDLFGDFTCDLVLGSWEARSFCFIEFEDASPTSIFQKRGKKETLEWGNRFEHGYSQVIDWFHTLTKMTEHSKFQKRFGSRTINFDGSLVIGRDQDLGAEELERFQWRSENSVICSKRINCFTFDGLLRLMKERLKTLSLLVNAIRSSENAGS
jgi:hypothetical protein